ncbi:sensor histidine kinase [Anaerosacchariphilus polymeriproducens]|uniref:histidine kinase n=1 Tax=Anaerosacchariphilus polymeriproducens TaxID=1812858 RepID=A0A371AWQ6_9FIRM|nr:HAMP domain-containing sensor histidine kinase [Anaerosacchariphilus polymeriproducens]RDU23910.1 sensor histidine kinase [Anaerosacchariphilus polymeriproducens]
MKSLRKILSNFILTALLIILITLIFNFCIYACFVFYFSTSKSNISLDKIAKELTQSNSGVSLSSNGLDLLQSKYSWAMLLDDNGNIIWDWQLPSDLFKTYTSSDIASFSKWYLKDYPVNGWNTKYGLLIVGSPKRSLWKSSLEIPTTAVYKFPVIILSILIINFIFILLLSLLFGYRFYRSLRIITNGIAGLANQSYTPLPEKGMTELLAKHLNQTATLLNKQNDFLSKRDSARTRWISGVSHDIRTPLSIIMGYTDCLKSDAALSQKQKKQISTIEEQSFQIKKLIEDLNLTSKLEYNMHPLRFTKYKLSALLRKVVTDFLNQDMDDKYQIYIDLPSSLENIFLLGDTNLLYRAYSNIILNSIKHNKNGCHINVSVILESSYVSISFCDSGKGIPKKIIELLKTDSEPDEKTHIMGLRIVKQIILAHNSEITFSNEQIIIKMPL